MSRAHSTPFAGTIVAATLASALATYAQAQPTPELESDRRGFYVGSGTCANGACHGASEPQAGQKILGNEYHTRVLDPHFRAYQILESELSERIAAALKPGTRAWEMDICLDCHSVNVPPRLNQGLYVDDGISCEGCHGPAGGWVNRHFEDGWSHQQSVRAGMTDLRQPAARARVCLDCHQGRVTADSVALTVDHRLIAAGHPPLRFELDNYSEEPSLRHWRLDRKGSRENHGIEAWAIGQAASFRAGLELLAAKAGGDGPWPEFAELSCANCHHPLDGTWRQQPGYRFRDGLPQWSPARWIVLRQMTAVVVPRQLDRLDLEVQDLARQVAAMSNRQDVADRARNLADSLGDMISRLDGVRWNRRRVLELMQAIAGGPESISDLASAEQVALSLHSLSSHLTRRDPRLLTGPMVVAVDGLFAELEGDDFERIEFADRLEKLLGSL